MLLFSSDQPKSKFGLLVVVIAILLFVFITLYFFRVAQKDDFSEHVLFDTISSDDVPVVFDEDEVINYAK